MDSTEVTIAEESSLAGALAGLMPVRQIDGYEMPGQSPIVDKVRERFRNAVRGVQLDQAIDLSLVCDEQV
jgi:branched-subunit amino acid aminotransferase/4-amino-4-deoxychorismate lyase